MNPHFFVTFRAGKQSTPTASAFRPELRLCTSLHGNLSISFFNARSLSAGENLTFRGELMDFLCELTIFRRDFCRRTAMRKTSHICE